MPEKLDWFPIDTRILPFDFSLRAPTSRLVRMALLLEFSLAFITVIGTLLLIFLPSPVTPLSQATTTSALTNPAGCR